MIMSVKISTNLIASFILLQFVEHMVRNFKEALKNCRWDAARYSLRFLADLVNCHVIAATSLIQLLDNMVDVAKEEGVPNVCIHISYSHSSNFPD